MARSMAIVALLVVLGGHALAQPVVRAPSSISQETWAQLYGQRVGWVLAMQSVCKTGAAMQASAENRVGLVRGEIERGSNGGVALIFSSGVDSGRAQFKEDLAGLDAPAKADACGRFWRIQQRFLSTGEVIQSRDSH